jgi:hypothetical protein
VQNKGWQEPPRDSPPAGLDILHAVREVQMTRIRSGTEAHLARAIVFGLVAALTVASAGAQEKRVAAAASPVRPGRLVGVFDLDTGQPLEGVKVLDLRTGSSALTTNTGTLSLFFVDTSGTLVRITKLGYQAQSFFVANSVADTAGITVLLKATAPTLPTVVTNARGAAALTGKLSEFDERRRLGLGNFLTEDVLMKNENRRMSEIFAMVPGTSVVQGTTNAAWIATSRGPSLNKQPLTEMDRRRGAKNACYAAVVLDGTFVYQGMLGETLFDINSLQPSAIAGIEVYSGSNMPSKYDGTRNTCGLVVIWTK